MFLHFRLLLALRHAQELSHMDERERISALNDFKAELYLALARMEHIISSLCTKEDLLTDFLRRGGEVLRKLRCKYCRHPLSPVYLCASQHRTFSYSAAPGWAIQLVGS
jgi:hypothetical protein